jgi:parallel beta-helix repeat protein
VVVDELAFAVLTNNTIQNNPGAGIFVSESSTARIGFNSDAESTASPNTIQSNGLGIVVMNGAGARIIGNNINNNSGDGVQVLRDSHADIASNAISGNGSDGIEVLENSTVQLGEDSGTSIYESPNTSTFTNTGFGIRCTTGGSADGRQGTLSGAGGAKNFTGAGCIDSLL